MGLCTERLAGITPDNPAASCCVRRGSLGFALRPCVEVDVVSCLARDLQSLHLAPLGVMAICPNLSKEKDHEEEFLFACTALGILTVMLLPESVYAQRGGGGARSSRRRPEAAAVNEAAVANAAGVGANAAGVVIGTVVAGVVIGTGVAGVVIWKPGWLGLESRLLWLGRYPYYGATTRMITRLQPYYSDYGSQPYYSADQYSTPRYYTGNDQGSNQNTQNTTAVRVILPDANAQVTFEDHKTQQRGSDRLFVSPPLEPGRNIPIPSRPPLIQNGQQVTQTKTVSGARRPAGVVDS